MGMMRFSWKGKSGIALSEVGRDTPERHIMGMALVV